MQIRKARLSDARILYKLAGNMEEMIGSKEISGYTLKEIKSWMKKKDKMWLVAEILKGRKKEISGFLLAMFLSDEWCVIDSIGVKKEYRGKGMGKLLFKSLIKICKKKKISYLQTLVDFKNKPAQKFWKNMGFQKGKTFIWLDQAF
jgi:ribosomal protein S18 acetylase RimI-like enzyme